MFELFHSLSQISFKSSGNGDNVMYNICNKKSLKKQENRA